MDRKEKYKIAIIIFIMVVITFLTSYYGSTDVGDYTDSSKYFAGKYNADIRNSHSYLMGFVHSPLVYLSENFIFFKITSILFILLIIYSLYIISNRNKKVLWMALLSPIFWYMAPWVSPIQIASLFLIWAYYNIKLYQNSGKTKNLFFSGILLGLGLSFWDTMLYLSIILGVVFLIDKRFYHSLYFGLAFIIGLFPRLLLDSYLFGFPFYTLIKTFISGFVSVFFGGIYTQNFETFRLAYFLLVFLSLPLYFWIIFRKEVFLKNKRDILFVLLSFLLILTNPQIRYVLAIVPIMLLIIYPYMNYKSLRNYYIYSTIIIFLFFFPYIAQISYNINGGISGTDITGIFISQKFEIDSENPAKIILADLKEIEKEYPDETFVVGNLADDYQSLAHIYWGSGIKEFVSIQDYDLEEKNESVLFSKRFEPSPRISERRQFWIEGGLKKNEDDTNYEEIEYALGIGEPVKIDDFAVVKKYNILVLSKKI